MPSLDTCSFPISSGGFSTSEVEYPRLFFRILGDIFGNMYCLRHSRKLKYLGTTKTPSQNPKNPTKDMSESLKIPKNPQESPESPKIPENL